MIGSKYLVKDRMYYMEMLWGEHSLGDWFKIVMKRPGDPELTHVTLNYLYPLP